MIHLLTIVDEPYWRQKMGPWVQSIGLNNNPQQVVVHVVTQGFVATVEDRVKYPYLDFRYLDPKTLKVNNTNKCVQEGGWLSVFPEAKDDDVYVVIDGDALMQRPFTGSEIAYLKSFDSTTMAMNWNAGVGDTLGAEGARIWPIKPLHEIQARWCPQGWFPCHNAGVMAAKISCWKPFYELYCEHWNETEQYFNHIARQQWLINWCAYTPPFHCEILPFTFHTHGHYGLVPGVTVENSGIAKFNGDVVLFRHKIEWHPYGA